MNTVHPKVAASGVAGAVTILLVFAAEKAGLEVPAEVASAFTVILSFLAGYLKRGPGPSGRIIHGDAVD